MCSSFLSQSQLYPYPVTCFVKVSSLQLLCHTGFQNGNIAAKFEVSWFSLLRLGKKEEFQSKDQTETQLVAVAYIRSVYTTAVISCVRLEM